MGNNLIIIVQIVHIHGPLKGEIQEFKENRILIGRHYSCQLRFPQELDIVSRKHALIVKEGNRFKLIDQQSTNGTYLNGVLVHETYLKVGDVISFAEGGPKVSFLTKIDEEGSPAAIRPEAPASPQNILKRERPPRVHIDYEVEAPFDDAKIILVPEPSPIQVSTPDPTYPPDTNSWMQAIRNELDSYPLGQILFNPPKTMRVGTSERIEVRITQNLKTDVANNLKGRGIPEIVTGKVAPFMKVKLSGSDFEINALNEESQIISPNDFTEWAWDVLPLKSGKKKLHLLISIRLKLSFGEEKKDFPIIDKNVEVRVNRIHSTKLFVVKHWKWIATAIVSPILVWIVKNWLTKT